LTSDDWPSGIAPGGHGVVDESGHVSGDDLNRLADAAAGALLGGRRDLGEARVTFLIPPSRHYVSTLHGIWRAGGIAVPLALSHPPPELEYVVRDAGAAALVVDPALRDRVADIAARCGVRLLTTTDLAGSPAAAGPRLSRERRALMLYTSGTTGRPKGVVWTHGNVRVQVQSLVEAWDWTSRDRTLLVLPLHHVHGLINVVCCALDVGATCEMHARFDAEATWGRLASGELTVFTAVPTVYYRLIQAWTAEPARQAARSTGARRLRLMMSGSAALPVATLERWRDITGHVLLERYGMTEIGMALANPLCGERRPGFVGQPLPGVEARIVDDGGSIVADGEPGEIEVRGAGVFGEYWQRPDATAEAFRDGWFRTGDTAVVEDGAFRLLGRSSVDILKTGGFKVSALEIEDVLRAHPLVADCAVIGVDDQEWGQRVCAAIELKSGSLPVDGLKDWLAERLAPYKQPRTIRLVDSLPRNAMGKVVKTALRSLFS
jgi:malonyl-CoA/methylmalonyl-CoA synthetase